jgi:sarcosine oxidase subunit beta
MKADVLIIGGGIIGLSVAYHIARRSPSSEVVVLEREAMVGTGATAKATGGMRHQFASEANILLSLISIAAYRRYRDEMGVDIEFEPHGYLFVTTDPQKMQHLANSVDLQRRLGVNSRVVTPRDASTLLPALKHEDLIGGSFCGDDGSGNPYAATMGYYRRAREMGASVRLQEEVVAIEPGTSITVRTRQETYTAAVVVDAAGPFADQVASMVGLDIPAHPFRRQVVVCAPLEELVPPVPFTVDLDTGWYVHRQVEGALLMGGTDRDARPGTDEIVDWDQVDVVADAAARRVPVLEKARVMRVYAGVRSLTPDDHAILGPTPQVPGFYLAVGLGGHGFMHAPAVGQVMAEVILDGTSTSVDLRAFSLERFQQTRAKEEAIQF